MLEASAATAELRSRNRQALGISTLQRGFDLDALMRAYQSTVRRMPRSVFEVDASQTTVESAWLGDWEAAYDIALQQTSTYIDSVTRNKNPAWTAVTGYYAAFFVARSLLYGVGVGHRGLPRRGVMGGGLYELTIAPGPGVGFVTLRCTKQPAGGSHKNAWSEVDRLLSQLMVIGGLDLASVNIIASMRNLLARPQAVSAFRNRVNYSLEIAGHPVTQWSTELTRVHDAHELEAAIAAGQPRRDENRIELLLLAMLSWNQELYSDYLQRASRPDRRRKRERDKVAAGDASVRAILQRWL